MKQFFLNLREIFWTNKNFFAMTILIFIFLFLSLKIFSFFLGWWGAALIVILISFSSVVQYRYEKSMKQFIYRGGNWLDRQINKLRRRRI